MPLDPPWIRIVSPATSRPRSSTVGPDGEEGFGNSRGLNQVQAAGNQEDCGAGAEQYSAYTPLTSAQTRSPVLQDVTPEQRQRFRQRFQARGYPMRQAAADTCLALHHVGTIDAGGHHFDEHFASSDGRRRPLDWDGTSGGPGARIDRDHSGPLYALRPIRSVRLQADSVGRLRPKPDTTGLRPHASW